MSKRDDGGPAFPATAEQYDYGQDRFTQKQYATGMTLRDYFASRAPEMPPGWADRPMPTGFEGPCLAWMAGLAATWSYEYADAMLEARQA